MSEMELHQAIKALIAQVIEIDEFADDANFVGELGVDSVMALEMVARLERRYRIRIPEERFAQMTSLNEVVSIVASLLQLVNN